MRDTYHEYLEGEKEMGEEEELMMEGDDAPEQEEGAEMRKS